MKTTLHLEDETAEALRQLAGVEGRSEAEVVREALALYRSKAEADSGSAKLTPREAQVFELIVEGLSNRSIGHHLGLHESTVRNYVISVLHKLGARSRSEVMARAIRPRPLPKGVGRYRSGRSDVSTRAEDLLREAARGRK